MKGYEGLTPTVEAIGKLNLTGNAVPRSWFQWLRHDDGKSNAVAIVLLSEFCRASNEQGVFCTSYQSLSDELLFTKRQVAENVKWLQSKEFIAAKASTAGKLIINLELGAIFRISLDTAPPEDQEEFAAIESIQTAKPSREKSKRCTRPKIGKSKRQKIFEKSGWICHYCKKALTPASGESPCVDHRMPLSRGGSNDFDNLVAACCNCNAKKSDKYTESEFLAAIGGVV